MLSTDRTQLPRFAYATLPADDEHARRAVEHGARIIDPFDAARDQDPMPLYTNEDWLWADPYDLIDGPIVLTFGDEDDEWNFERALEQAGA